MNVNDAQREMREVYLGGATGPLVSGTIWIVSTLVATQVSRGAGIWTLILGGALIFPLATLLLKLTGRRAAASRENPLNALAMQIAFTIPAAYPVIAAATIHNVNWFYPAMLVIVGAHYLPFIFLYGMPIYGALALGLVLGGTWVGQMCGDHFTYGGWFGGAVLLLSALPIYWIGGRNDGRAA